MFLSKTITIQPLLASHISQLDELYLPAQSPTLDFLSRVLNKPTGRSWCIVESEQIIGVAWFSVVGTEAEIIDIRVSANHRRRGYGHRLLHDSVSVLSSYGIQTVFLEVRCTNTAAISLYEKLGFAVIARREDYYEASAGREDALVMRRQS